jgi:hypothetical protein
MRVLNAVEDGQYIPLDNLLDSIRSLSTDISKHQPNAYIFASGSINSTRDVEYTKYTKLLSEKGERFVTIGNTEASRFWESYGGIFEDRIATAIKASGDALRPADILHGYTGADGKRVSGLWDDISRGYAQNAQGHVITVTPNANAQRIFVQTELPALLENPKIETINALPKQVFLDEFDRLKAAGATAEQAYTRLSDTLVRSSSISFMERFATSGFKADLGVNIRHGFTGAAHNDIAALVKEANPQNVGLKPLSEGVETLVEKPGLLKALKVAGKTAKFLPVAGTALGIGINTAEARELENKLQAAVDNGQVSREALLEYDAILAGHIAQGGDPSVVLGEGAVQGAFEAWADRHHVRGELRDSLRPESLALMAKHGAEYIGNNIDRLPQATRDVASFAGQQAIVGVAATATGAADRVADAYDHVTGHAEQRRAVYDALPVLAQAANEDIYDPSTIDDPIHTYPAAYDLAQIKTGIVNTQAMIAEINDGARAPFNGMSKAESAEFLQESVERLDARFKDSYGQADADGTLGEVMDYAARYGALNMAKAAPQLTILDGVAANQPFEAPKARALAM